MRRPVAVTAALAGLAAAALVAPSAAQAGGRADGHGHGSHPGHHDPGPVTPSAPKVPVMTGGGGAVASVDDVATQVGIDVLRHGGNAADAAVAAAATLGVTEPFSSGIGGGGYLVYYDAKHRRVEALDGRETAPRTFTSTTFTDGNGKPLDFATVVNSGLSVGVPGTPALWDAAARRWGTRSFARLMQPAEEVARRGFVVDATFNQQVSDNAARFARFPATAALYLKGGQPPATGSVFRNPDMAKAYRELQRHGVGALYRGELGAALVREAQHPHTSDGSTVYPGQLTRRDLASYRALLREPTTTRYRGLEVRGMPVSSSGGIATGESLNLLEAYDHQTGTKLSDVDETQYLHRFSEATATAFADRGRWVGSVPGVPTRELTSQGFADERACTLFSPTKAATRPLPFGNPDGSYACDGAAGRTSAIRDDHGTTHLTVADRWGDVASYTLTIEQTGGSGITVPGWGFLLNNELTDFNFVPVTAGVPDPNLPGAGKRPRSSMSPTIVTSHGRPVLALGSPGGATIITTVTQVLTEYVDRGLPLVDAIAAPRLSSRNGAAEEAEPAIYDGPLGAALTGLGHVLKANPEIGAATGIVLRRDGTFQAAAETTRRGGGSAMVVRPQR
ncbi:gamma-glutamyltransferase [Angustibacter peucedani]